MTTHECGKACGAGGRGPSRYGGQAGSPGRLSGPMRALGFALVLALLFSGDIVRIHGHADGAPASADCAACVAGLTSAVEAHPSPALDPPAPSTAAAAAVATSAAPCLVFVRQGGLRDPPTPFA